MKLEEKSKELKSLLDPYDTQWMLGDLSGLLSAISRNGAQDQLGRLSSPMRQLFFLGGLLMSTDPKGADKTHYSLDEWDKIIDILNEIEAEYELLFLPKEAGEMTEEWKKHRQVAMPSFLAYFNQGPLNYEEQDIEWIGRLFSQLDGIISTKTGLTTANFLEFYNNLDTLYQKNFQSFLSPKAPVKKDWRKYTKVKMVNTAPPELKYFPDESEIAMFHFMSDKGLPNRFFPEELVTSELSLSQVLAILNLLASERAETDFLFYTSTKPGNPLSEMPIVKLEDGMYQVFEVKQVLHATENLLETLCCDNKTNTTSYSQKKGKLLEEKISEIFSSFFDGDCVIIKGYYIDGCEQDILVLWKKYAFIVEAKGYALKEPFRDPAKAYIRIKSEFDNSITYGYQQCKRVQDKFLAGEPLILTDNKGDVIKEIDTTKYNDAFSIVVNLEPFGQIQTDLSILLEVEDEDEVYPWAVKLDDLEVFLLMIKNMKKNQITLVNYLFMRENLHGKLVCSDELEVCGGFLSGKLTYKIVEEAEMVMTVNDLTSIFDQQYRKGMGFKDEKMIMEKSSGKYLML